MSAQPWSAPIFLYGPPGSGKSRVGNALAADLELLHIELDAEIERRAGTTISALMAEKGEAVFRALESSAIREIAPGTRAVISLGGGSLLEPANRAAVEALGPVACLTGSYETLLSRLAADGDRRPLLSGGLAERLGSLLARRAEHYASFPLQVATDNLPPEEIAWQVQGSLGQFLFPGDCPVFIQPGGLDACGDALRSLRLKGPLALVSDENVARFHLPRAAGALRECGYTVQEIVISAGEQHKTIETVARLWDAFIEAGLERGSTVVGLGGGVVTDLAGFAAAAYLRGIPWAALPTTLLGMVDAALGGKTGADLPAGKNLIGAFHPPRLVLADPLVLDTLPEAELVNGMAEVVKHGMIGDPQLFEICAGGWEAVRAHWDEVLRRAVGVKARVVREDPTEQGRRAALNYGHTIGHGLEAASGYRLRHGEAVAAGMVAEARLAEAIGLAPAGLAEAVASALRGLGLPTEIEEGIKAEAFERAFRTDKKRMNGRVRFALPAAVGDVRVGVAVDRETVDRVL